MNVSICIVCQQADSPVMCSPNLLMRHALYKLIVLPNISVWVCIASAHRRVKISGGWRELVPLGNKEFRPTPSAVMLMLKNAEI